MTGRMLKATIRRDGYWTHGLKWKGRRAGILTHRTMLMVFVGPPPTPAHQARHLDGNPRNCTLENLAWGTPGENAADKRRHGTVLFGERSPVSRLTSTDVLAIRAMRGAVHPDEVAATFGIHRTYVYMIWRGVTWRHLDA